MSLKRRINNEQLTWNKDLKHGEQIYIIYKEELREVYGR